MGKQPEFLKGKLLLDSGQLSGSFFQRTVILVCEHDENGAVGLVLNRNSGNKFSEVVTVNLPGKIGDQILYVGGPVQLSAISFLHADGLTNGVDALPHLELGCSLDVLEDLNESFTNKNFRMFAGYAGWTGGQLEEEIQRQAWLTHPASMDLVFDAEPEKLWQKILRAKGGKYQLLAGMPDDPSLN